MYKYIRYKILPVLSNDYKATERELTVLANESDNAERIMEAHIVRTIVKPYIQDLNLKMTAMEKVKTVPPMIMGKDYLSTK